MKLRNKKTGEVIDAECRNSLGGGLWIVRKEGDKPVHVELYNSIAGLVADWEDYKPDEPLIKDERTRKAVRAWAETNSIKEISYSARLYGSSCLLTDIGGDQWSIEFVGWIPTLEDGKTYTIAELCGEEEAPEPLEPNFIDLDERIREKEEE